MSSEVEPARATEGSGLDPTTVAPEVWAFVYEESVRALTQQAAVVDNIRTRTGTLIAATSLVTALLAGPTLSLRGVTPGSMGAIVLFFISALLALWVLWPTRGWTFSFDAKEVVTHLDERPKDLARLHRQLARLNGKYYAANDAKVDALFGRFKWSVLFLVAEIGAWITALFGLCIGGIAF